MLIQRALQPVLFKRTPSIYSMRNDSTAAPAGGTSFTVAITVPSIANCLVVVAEWGRNAASTFTSLTYDGVTMTAPAAAQSILTGAPTAANKAYVVVAYLFNPRKEAAQNLVCTVSAADQISLSSYFIRGANAYHAGNGANRIGSSGTSYTIPVVTTRPSLIIGGRSGDRGAGAITGTPGTDYTERYDTTLNGAGWHYSQSRTSPSVGSIDFGVTASATWGATNTDAIAAMSIV